MKKAKAKAPKPVKINKASRIGLRISPEMAEQITTIAGIRGQKESEAIRDIIELGLAEFVKLYTVDGRLAA